MRREACGVLCVVCCVLCVVCCAHRMEHTGSDGKAVNCGMCAVCERGGACVLVVATAACTCSHLHTHTQVTKAQEAWVLSYLLYRLQNPTVVQSDVVFFSNFHVAVDIAKERRALGTTAADKYHAVWVAAYGEAMQAAADKQGPRAKLQGNAPYDFEAPHVKHDDLGFC